MNPPINTSKLDLSGFKNLEGLIRPVQVSAFVTERSINNTAIELRNHFAKLAAGIVVGNISVVPNVLKFAQEIQIDWSDIDES